MADSHALRVNTRVTRELEQPTRTTVATRGTTPKYVTGLRNLHMAISSYFFSFRRSAIAFIVCYYRRATVIIYKSI